MTGFAICSTDDITNNITSDTLIMDWESVFECSLCVPYRYNLQGRSSKPQLMKPKPHYYIIYYSNVAYSWFHCFLFVFILSHTVQTISG